VKVCVVIPCFDHDRTVGDVARAALAFAPVIVVDDGSLQPIPQVPGVAILRLPKNQGKAAALRAGFRWAAENGFTHAVTIDADGQHSVADLPRFLSAAQAQPDALIVGVRDLVAAGAPPGRRRSNAVSSFWYHVETGVRLKDTQCGFRCYPVALAQRLRTRSNRYAFELEFMVRAAWVGTPIVAVPIHCTYQPAQLSQSHFRPVMDLAHITFMNIGLVLQSWLVPHKLRAIWSFGEHRSRFKTVREFFADHAEHPAQLAFAVGLGLFCGIAPIWGYQMLVAATLAHWLRLNKAIALLASNISIPPIAPFILYGGLALGHWLFTGKALEFSARQITYARAVSYLWQWCVGSFALGTLVGLAGAVATYGVARCVGLRRRPIAS
jgi:uncharacterized protein (DUF2062 family)